ncbi:hypothetical protein TKK_0004991 [Trichogramma kaykai]|uniref:HTH psq-type domain-containing protein n=1 Tax=Trichogramma kaykai TaxID=54128 RepID=A0ABD2XK65_9HYME
MEPEGQRKKVIALGLKIDILNELRDHGGTPTSIGRKYGLGESTIRNFRLNEESLRAKYAQTCPKQQVRNIKINNTIIPVQAGFDDSDCDES